MGTWSEGKGTGGDSHVENFQKAKKGWGRMRRRGSAEYGTHTAETCLPSNRAFSNSTSQVLASEEEGGGVGAWLPSDKITSGPLSIAPPSCCLLQRSGCLGAPRPVTCDCLPSLQLLNREQTVEMFILVCPAALP